MGWDFESVWTMDEEQGRPVLRSFLNPVGPEPEDPEPVEPDPTEETIAAAADLEKIRSNPAGDYILTEDIQLEGEFTPISNFSGTLDSGTYDHRLEDYGGRSAEDRIFCGELRYDPEPGIFRCNGTRDFF